MPHLILECCDNVSIPKNLKAIQLSMHGVLNSAGGIKLDNCKSRLYRSSNSVVADGGSEHAYLHLDVSFLEGRTMDVNQAIGSALLDILSAAFCPINTTLALQITVEIKDISKHTYFKYPSGSLNY